jgi:hypothetical protein
MGMTRKTQQEGVIYVTPNREVFASPDGEGRVWFDTVNEAKGETGLTKVVYLLEAPEDY